jgi:hypothetical protein
MSSTILPEASLLPSSSTATAANIGSWLRRSVSRTAFRRQPNTWLGDIPYARANADTFTPGIIDLATISSFADLDQRRPGVAGLAI